MSPNLVIEREREKRKGKQKATITTYRTIQQTSICSQRPAVPSLTMMIPIWFGPSESNIMDVVMPHANMVLDPRFMGGWVHAYEFSFSVKGRTLTITRTDADEGWPDDFHLRAYLPTEDIPDFTSTVYTCWGLEHERAPKDVTEVNFHPSVTTIQNGTFYFCRSLVRVKIPDHVTHIERFAFKCCHSLKSLQLSTNIEFIGKMAFHSCESLEAVFLPPTVTHIGDDAFGGCYSLRFFNLPEPIQHLGSNVLQGCDSLSTTVSNNLSKVCYSTSVTPQSIQKCIAAHGIECATEVNDQQMTALHILCANPHVTVDCIRAYLQFAPEAAEQQDSEEMTPFQYLCTNDITFLDDRSFSSLMAWWYGCMPPQTETTGKKRKRG